MISIVDPETRHGHKTSSRSFDGYKGHIALDPESEIITKTVVGAGNASVAEELIEDLLGRNDACDIDPENPIAESQSSCVYGDAAYGTGQNRSRLKGSSHRLKVQDTATKGKRGSVHKGQLPHRPRSRDGPLSREYRGQDPTPKRR